MIKHLTKIIVIAFCVSILFACGGSETEVTSTPLPAPDPAPPATYSGPPASTDDISQFKTNVWDNLVEVASCNSCHVQDKTQPAFARFDDINLAYSEFNPLVDRNNLANSIVVSKVAGGHNCWKQSSASSNAQCADDIESWLGAWLNSNSSENEIKLSAPTVKLVGANKNFPAEPDLFASTMHPILEMYCSECHQPSAAVPISPFVGSSDLSEAYFASISKTNLDDPASSRLVARLRDEFHNCWTDSCVSDAQVLEQAIQSMSDQIEVTELDSNLVASHAVNLLQDGILASGGGRFESHIIAKYDFKSNDPSIVFDTSGVTPALDLTLSGSVEKVEGVGLRFSGGKAQGSTANSKKLYDNMLNTGEFSIEAWIAPANVTQEGPARIISYSGGDMTRNFMLGQTLYNYDFLLRHNNTDTAGLPALSTANADEVLQAALQHVVINYDANGGRRIFVNGQDTEYVDGIEGASLSEWDDSFAFALGSEVSGRFSFHGTLRMVAIHNRKLTPQQILGNFEAGVGDRYYLLFGISDIINTPQSYIGFEASIFDQHSYLFSEPFAVSLDDQANLDGIDIRGVRLGINGREEKTGQVYANLNTVLDGQSTRSEFGQKISRLGTIMPRQKGPELDDFFITFENLGGMQSARPEPSPISISQPIDIAPSSDIGIRNFAEINASMSAITQVASNRNEIQSTYNTLKQQLPSVTNIDSFLTANQMAITQLAIRYCDTLIEDDELRNEFFPNLAINQDLNSGISQSLRDSIIQPLTNNMLNDGDTNQPSETSLATELNELINALGACSNNNSCNSNATRTLAKASCAAVLGSAVLVLQ